MISAIIPARNEEASIARAVESVAAQPEVAEVIVVNDQSTDQTAEILNEFESRILKLRVVNISELPAGWIGKNYAASAGAAVAKSEWLLFTDADTYHYLGAARRALSDAVDRGAVLVSYSPEQQMKSFWERALIPFVYCRLGAKFSYRRVNNPDLPDAAANGQFILILREVYQAVGGHGAVAGEVLEDVALAQRVKAAGHKIYFTAPMGIVRTRMYQSLGAMWEGWTKNLYRLLGGTAGTAAKELVCITAQPLLLIAFIALLAWMLGRSGNVVATPFLVAAGAAGLAAWHAWYGIELSKNLFPLAYILYLLPGAGLYAAVVLSSWRKNLRGTVVWKGREYRARA